MILKLRKDGMNQYQNQSRAMYRSTDKTSQAFKLFGALEEIPRSSDESH